MFQHSLRFLACSNEKNIPFLLEVTLFRWGPQEDRQEAGEIILELKIRLNIL
jgi:hypothetical protein